MASDREYLDYVMEQLGGLDGVSYRKMMGEYILYYKGKIPGGIYDNCFLVKPVEAAKRLMPNASRVVPYPNAAEMLLVDNIEDPGFLAELFDAMYDELPETKRR